MSNPLVSPDDDGIRPAGSPDECFYCGAKVGEQHKADCVILCRKVKVRYSFDIEVEVPHFWTAADIDFHRHESSWCADSAIAELSDYADQIGCLCDVFQATVLDIPDAQPYRRNKKGDIVP